jgi:hypothetical protein
LLATGNAVEPAQQTPQAAVSLAEVIKTVSSPIVRIDADSAARTGSNMIPHPEAFLFGGGKSGTWLGLVGDAELRQFGRLPKLHDVTIRECPITDAGVCDLATPQLTKVSLQSTKPLTDAALRGWDKASELTELTIGPVEWNAAAFQTLAKLPKLQRLTITGGKLTGGGVALLSQSKSLTYLAIHGVDLGDAGLDQLALESLSSLDLTGCTLSPADWVNIAKLKSLAGLTLSSTNLADEGLGKLLALENLESFRFDGTGVTFAGAMQLRPLRKLKWICYDGPPQIQPQDIQPQQQRLANALGWTFEGACSCGCLDVGPREMK